MRVRRTPDNRIIITEKFSTPRVAHTLSSLTSRKCISRPEITAAAGSKTKAFTWKVEVLALFLELCMDLELELLMELSLLVRADLPALTGVVNSRSCSVNS